MARKDTIARFEDKFHRKIKPGILNASHGPKLAHLDGKDFKALEQGFKESIIHLCPRGCGKTFKGIGGYKRLQRHTSMVHGATRIPGLCPDGCGKRLESKVHASRHALLIHRTPLAHAADHDSEILCSVVHCVNNVKRQPLSGNSRLLKKCT